MFFICTIMIFVSSIHSSKAQGEKPKNTVYLTYGNIIFSAQVSGAYERTFFQKNKLRTKGKINAGGYLYNHADYADGAKVYSSYVSLSAVQLLSIVEINAGLAYTSFSRAQNLSGTSDMVNALEFYGCLGLRFEKNNIIIRGGLGNLELLYIGLGFNF